VVFANATHLEHLFHFGPTALARACLS
jgi:hypothetical protein